MNRRPLLTKICSADFELFLNTECRMSEQLKENSHEGSFSKPLVAQKKFSTPCPARQFKALTATK